MRPYDAYELKPEFRIGQSRYQMYFSVLMPLDWAP